MAANTNPIFPIAPVLGIASLTTPNAVAIRSNVNVAGLNATSYAQLVAPSTNGVRIDAITYTAKGNTTAAMVDIWISDGVSLKYFTSLDISAVVASATVDPFTVTKQFVNLVLPPAYSLYVSTSVQQDGNVFAFGGSY